MSQLFSIVNSRSLLNSLVLFAAFFIVACDPSEETNNGASPVITILGDNPATVEQGQSYTDAGATASDTEDGDITANITTTDTVNTSLTGNYEVNYSVTDVDGNETIATRAVIVTEPGVVPPQSLNQAAFNGSTYQYGFDSINNVVIYNAPADTDRDRWAMAHDGTRYRLYFFKLDSDNTMYQFAFNPATSRYEYGYDSIATLTISGMPLDADTSSFAMLHDGIRYRLYMKSATNSARMYQAAFNGSVYQYGFDSISILDITSAPADTDYVRWTMLHDGTRYRLYIFRQNSNAAFYQFAFNPSTGNYEYGFDSISLLNVTGMPTNSDTSNMAMLHDGIRYRFYFQTQ